MSLLFIVIGASAGAELGAGVLDTLGTGGFADSVYRHGAPSLRPISLEASGSRPR